VINNAPKQTQPPTQAASENIFEMGLGSVSFETTQPQPVNNGGDLFGMLGFGTSSPQPQPTTQPVNTGFGGDLLGFGLSTPTQPPQPQPPAQVNSGFSGSDLMGFGFSTGPSNPSPPVQSTAQTGFNFGLGPSQPQTVQAPQPQPQNNNFGFNLLGSQSTSVQPVTQTTQASTFQPIVNNNPNKILAYDNNHLQIWIDCIK